ncbi:MAG: aspartyl protease family protein [Novosphingobium sp.]|nr:aspartyl protease family protein [Novosphingobium sp.]
MAAARLLVATMPRGAERCAVEGEIASRENRLDEAERLLSRCLLSLERTRSTRGRAALDALVDVYRRRGEYGYETALLVRWLDTHAKTGDLEEFADLRNELGTAAALRGASRREPTGDKATVLHAYVNPLGTRSVDLTVRGVTLPWMIDTGANYSVVSESAARRMGLKIRDASYQVAGSTGHTVATRLSLIDSLPVGGMILHDVVAIVVPDEGLHIRSSRADYQIEAALGYPALAQLGRFRIDSDGTFAIDRAAPLLRSGAALYMSQLTPLAEVEISGTKGVLSVDTGATRTELYASYADRFRERASIWTRKKDGTSGLGGNAEGDVAVEPRLTMVAGGHSVTEKNVSIALVGDRSAAVLGNLGQTFLTLYGSYTFDFRSMRLQLGGPNHADRIPSDRS